MEEARRGEASRRWFEQQAVDRDPIKHHAGEILTQFTLSLCRVCRTGSASYYTNTIDKGQKAWSTKRRVQWALGRADDHPLTRRLLVTGIQLGTKNARRDAVRMTSRTCCCTSNVCSHQQAKNGKKPRSGHHRSKNCCNQIQCNWLCGKGGCAPRQAD